MLKITGAIKGIVPSFFPFLIGFQDTGSLPNLYLASNVHKAILKIHRYLFSHLIENIQSGCKRDRYLMYALIEAIEVFSMSFALY